MDGLCSRVNGGTQLRELGTMLGRGGFASDQVVLARGVLGPIGSGAPVLGSVQVRLDLREDAILALGYPCERHQVTCPKGIP